MMHRAHRNDGYNDEEEDFRRIIDSIPPPTPPDGGWGWMVVFASFMINAIVDGFCYSFGILLPEFTHHFNINTSDITSTAALRQHTLTLTQATAQTRYPTATISFGGALLLGTYMLSGTSEENVTVESAHGVREGFFDKYDSISKVRNSLTRMIWLSL